MTNRGTRVRSGNYKKPRLRYLSLAFESNSNTKENLENGKRPHGGIKGEKKHPLSPYSYNREPQYHQELQDDIDKLFREEFIEQHGSPEWVTEANKDVTHTDESPLLVNKLLSPSKQAKNDEICLESLGRHSGRRSAPPTRRSDTSFYRPNSTHQYLSSTETRNSAENGYDIRYGRPTRTTLLRARQRSNSTPINAYEARRESTSTRRLDSPSPVYGSRETINVSNPGESRHSFLTGARYNRAHYLDAKSLSVYGVYMPRNNPHACFVTGHASARIKDGGEIPAAPPDSPRSDMDDLSLPLHLKRPATAPGKRLLISTAPPSGRPKSAWGDVTTTCNISESENNANTELSNNTPVIEELIIIPGDLNVRGSRIVVTIKGSKSLSLSESKLPRVKGISVPRLTHNSARDPVDETSLVNQPPPTPVGDLSINEEQSVSMSVKLDSLKHDFALEKENEDERIEEKPLNEKKDENEQPTVESGEDKDLPKMEDSAKSPDHDQPIIDIPTDPSLPKQGRNEQVESVDINGRRVNWDDEKINTDITERNHVINVEISVIEKEECKETQNKPENINVTSASDQTFFITEEQEVASNSDLNKYSELDSKQPTSLKQTDQEDKRNNSLVELTNSLNENIKNSNSDNLSSEEKVDLKEN